tara:strand:+ start:5339 stop:5776 length:438 start_codon:yes stop_codon:yes gene_type:complete
MKLIRNLEHQAKLHRLSGANSMALLLQNAADRIGELESHLDAEANSCFILEGKNKDLEKSNAACAVAINEMISRGEVKSLLKGNSEIDDIVNNYALEQQEKGIEWLIENETTICRIQGAKRSVVFCVDAGARVSQLRNQAKELKS